MKNEKTIMVNIDLVAVISGFSALKKVYLLTKAVDKTKSRKNWKYRKKFGILVFGN